MTGAKAALKARVCALVDRDENFANQLRTMVDHYEAASHGGGSGGNGDDGNDEAATAAIAIATAKVHEEVEAGMCTFAFVSADYLRSLPDDAARLPPFQELCKVEGALVWHTLEAAEAYRGAYVSQLLAVSHRWEQPEAPDSMGAQQRAILRHLRTHPELVAVWYDYWCMPQGERTPVEKVGFKHMLSQVNLLYLGMRVLVLADISYLSRFWVRACAAAAR